MMRFPLSLTLTMAAYITKNKVMRRKRFPLVLMLEPLHACNLTCTGCGRIREYAETIKEWHRRFQLNRVKIAKLYDERFCRMWEFYLQASEMSFRRLGQTVFQIQLARRQDAVPLTRDYITDWERAHMAA